jgi:hypothetical protein
MNDRPALHKKTNRDFRRSTTSCSEAEIVTTDFTDYTDFGRG